MPRRARTGVSTFQAMSQLAETPHTSPRVLDSHRGRLPISPSRLADTAARAPATPDWMKHWPEIQAQITARPNQNASQPHSDQNLRNKTPHEPHEHSQILRAPCFRARRGAGAGARHAGAALRVAR